MPLDRGDTTDPFSAAEDQRRGGLRLDWGTPSLTLHQLAPPL